MGIRVSLPPAAHDALAELAIRDRRDARNEAAVLIIEALAARGLVSVDGLERSQRDDRELAAAR